MDNRRLGSHWIDLNSEFMFVRIPCFFFRKSFVLIWRFAVLCIIIIFLKVTFAAINSGWWHDLWIFIIINETTLVFIFIAAICRPFCLCICNIFSIRFSKNYKMREKQIICWWKIFNKITKKGSYFYTEGIDVTLTFFSFWIFPVITASLRNKIS